MFFKKKPNSYVLGTKGQIFLFTFENSKLSGLINTHVLLLNKQDAPTPPTPTEEVLELKNTQTKHKYSPTSWTNQALLSWHHYYIMKKVRSFNDQKPYHM